MTIRAYSNTECEKILEYETDLINIQEDDPDEAKQNIDSGYEMMLCFEKKDTFTWVCLPACLVIEIKG